jgi:hypothetical protein
MQTVHRYWDEYKDKWMLQTREPQPGDVIHVMQHVVDFGMSHYVRHDPFLYNGNTNWSVYANKDELALDRHLVSHTWPFDATAEYVYQTLFIQGHSKLEACIKTGSWVAARVELKQSI